MKQLLIIVLVGVIGFQTGSLWSIVKPVLPFVKIQNKLQIASIKVGIGDPGEKILKAVSMTSKQTGLSEALILSLMYSESSFKPNAVSSKHYQGLMQIPKSNLLMHQKEDVNTLIGARILQEKLKITDGDYRKAITIYKGWPVNDPEGKRQADKVMKLAKLLKEA